MHVVLFQSGATGYINKIHFKCICTHAYITYVLCIRPKYPRKPVHLYSVDWWPLHTASVSPLVANLSPSRQLPRLSIYIKMKKIITLPFISAVLIPQFKALRCWLQNLKRFHFPSTDSASVISLPQWSQTSDWVGARPWLENSRPVWRWTPLGLLQRCCLLFSQSWICWRLYLLPGKKWDHYTQLRGAQLTASCWCGSSRRLCCCCHNSIFQARKATKLPYSKMTDCLMIAQTSSYCCVSQLVQSTVHLVACTGVPADFLKLHGTLCGCVQQHLALE